MRAVPIGIRSTQRIQKSKESGILIDYGLGQEPRDPGLTWRPAKGVGGEVGPMPPRSLRYSYGSRIHCMRPRFRAGFPLRIFTVACRTTLPLATGTSSSHPPLAPPASLWHVNRGAKSPVLSRARHSMRRGCSAGPIAGGSRPLNWDEAHASICRTARSCVGRGHRLYARRAANS